MEHTKDKTLCQVTLTVRQRDWLLTLVERQPDTGDDDHDDMLALIASQLECADKLSGHHE